MVQRSHTFRNYFITGLITILPLWLTAVIVWVVFRWISGIASPLLIPLFRLLFGQESSILVMRLTSFFLTVFFIWVIGMVATHVVGRRFLLRFESLFVRLPIMKDIYLSVRKFIQFFSSQKNAFKRVVLVEFPRKGIYAIGFLTREAPDEFNRKTGKTLVDVFVPTPPNPATGFLVYVPQEEIIQLDLSIEEAIKFLLSGGIIVPEHKPVSTGNDEGIESQDV